MDIKAILDIVTYILLIVLGGLSLWYNGNKKISSHVVSFIKEAEKLYKDQTKAGGIKFQWVVTNLYNLIPTVLKPFISVDIVETLVQTTFDTIESYAKMQLDKSIDKISNK